MNRTVIEIVGVSGVGKSTLGLLLIQRFGDLSRKDNQASPSDGQFWQSISEAIRATWLIMRWHGINKATLDKSFKGVRASTRQYLARVKNGGVAIREPGWLSQIVALATHQRKPPTEAFIDAMMDAVQRPDVLVVLDLPEEKSLERIASRPRGLPKTLRALPEPALRDALMAGRMATGLIYDAAKRRGFHVLHFSTLDNSAQDIADIVVGSDRTGAGH